MKTLFPVPSFASGAVARPVPGWHWLALAGFCALVASADAANWALRFNGLNQYVELPLGETVILDDQSPRFGTTPAGTWTSSTATNGFKGRIYQASDPQATARWTPQLPRAGSYRVYAWWGGAASSLDPAVQFVVKSAGGFFTNVVNQKLNAGQWVLLGTYDFAANCEEFVSLRPSGTGLAVADAVRFVSDQAFDLAQAATLEAWVNFRVFDQSPHPIITKGQAWGILCYSNLLTFHTTDAAGNPHELTCSQALASNRWYHVAATFDGTKKTLYIDGAVAAAAVWQSALATNSYPVWFGGNAASPADTGFRGVMDNVRIWSVTRSQSDLQSCTNRTLRGTEGGLVGEWRFDDNARTNFLTLDSAAGALHGFLRESNAPPNLAAGLVFGSPLTGPLAVRFNGYDQYAVLPAPDNRFDFSEAGTIETWLYFDFSPSQPAGLISKGIASGWALVLDSTGRLIFRTPGLTGPDPTNAANQILTPELVSKSRLDPGNWYHVAAVWSKSAGQKSLYLNGVLDASATNLQGSVSASAQPVHFAAQPDISGRQNYFEGVLEEVRLWTVARRGDQITENFGRDLNGTEPGLAGFWKFDEGSGLVASDQGPYAVKANASLAGGMSNLNRVSGKTLGAALALQYCLSLNGQDEYAQIEPTNTFDLSNLTIEAWVKPTGNTLRTILRKGNNGYGLAVDGDGYLRFASSNAVQQWPRSSRTIEFERDAQGNAILDAQNHPVGDWNHVGVVVNRAANTTIFYINGKPAGTNNSSLVVNNTGPLLLGRDALTGIAYFQGLLDEVRLWNLPRSSVEVDLLAFAPLLGTAPPGLIGYWNFNQGTGATLPDYSGGGHNGSLVNVDLGNWQDGTDWGMPPLPSGLGGLNPNSAAAGLWVGQVVLNKVNEVQAAAQGAAAVPTAAPHAATIRILLHVDAAGQVRLLKDVVVMKRLSETNSASGTSTNPVSPVDISAPSTNLVLVTRPELIPNYQGVTVRGGKLVGLRYGTAAYDFDGLALPLLGGVGPGGACLGRISLSKDHPTNPYRHKYHPDHRSGFALTRQFTLLFDGEAGDPWQQAPGYGLDRLTGTYRETVVGLHKIPLLVEGSVRLDRINSVSVLDDGQ